MSPLGRNDWISPPRRFWAGQLLWLLCWTGIPLVFDLREGNDIAATGEALGVVSAVFGLVALHFVKPVQSFFERARVDARGLIFYGAAILIIGWFALWNLLDIPLEYLSTSKEVQYDVATGAPTVLFSAYMLWQIVEAWRLPPR